MLWILYLFFQKALASAGLCSITMHTRVTPSANTRTRFYLSLLFFQPTLLSPDTFARYLIVRFLCP